MPPTVIRGLSDEYGSWKTIWILRWSARERRSGRTLPSMQIWPLSGCCSPASALASVDLPDPDSPTSASASPRSIWRSTPSTACRRYASCRSRATSAEPSGKLTERPVAASRGPASPAGWTSAVTAAACSSLGSLRSYGLQRALEVQARGSPAAVKKTQSGIGHRAVLLSELAARVEPAAGRRTDQARR